MKSTALLIAALSIAACGSKKGNTTPDDGEEHTDPVQPGGGPQFEHNTGAQIPPEKMDETNQLLERKRNTVARCLGIAVDNKDLPKSSKGKVTLKIVIHKDGSADVSVASATIESKSLHQCVIDYVKKIVFPEMPHDFETSFTYAFEAT